MARTGSRGLSILLPLLLLVPPVGNLLRDLEKRRAQALAPGSEKAADAELAGVIEDRDRQLAWESERKARLVSAWTQPRYRPLLAGVVHLSDPSPRRSALWLSCERPEGVSPRTAVVSSGPEGALLGKVHRVWADRGILRAQTVLDPYFRVRFRYRDAWGFLWGTGRLDGDGRPMLEVRYWGAETARREGEVVFTDGEDGMYPPGIPIGVLARSSPSDPECMEVRSLVRLDSVVEVLLLVDGAALEVRSLREKEGGE